MLTDEAREHVWNRIPYHLLIQANFERLLIAARAENPRQQIQQVTNQIIGAVQGGAVFNPVQSTHTASVHRSVSESASKLKNSYGRRLNLAATIQEIKAFVNGLSDGVQHAAAKRCIERITAAGDSFTDPLSGVSTRLLLALTYTGIHDTSKCSATLDDAKALLVEGYYEVQRGYNFDKQGGGDNGAFPDKPICSSGAFNKIMEKLNGIHADVVIYYITKAGASNKYKILVEEHALRHLRSIASPQTDEGYQQCNAILEKMQQDNSLEPIWDSIKASVARELWDEFREAYGHNPEDIDFVSLMNEGWKDLEAPKELPAIQAQLGSSRCDLKEDLDAPLPEYVQLNHSDEGMLTYLANSWFFEHRHSSPEAQHHFDKQYGLSIISKSGRG